MGVFHCDELDLNVVRELIEDINDHYLLSEAALLELDRQPDDAELIISLFRSVHTIKGDLGIVGFSPAMPLINSVEDLLSLLRHGKVTYSPLMSDLVLLILDRVRSFVDNFNTQGYVEYDQPQVEELSQRIHQIVDTISQPADAQPDGQVQQDRMMAEVIQLLDPSVVIHSQPSELDQLFGQSPAFERQDVSSAVDLQMDDDLQFFRDLMVPVELRSQFWAGRGDRILKMSLILNQLANDPVDERQLAAAVYVHDFGMAFMPLDLLHKDGTLSNSEILLLRSHVQSSAHLLQNMLQWQTAREIVLQHHEAANGSGYPYGLREKEICDGAKILAVADTFDALTHQRAYSTHQKRPIIRAVKEINDYAGKQLSPYWVEIFNQAVQPILLAHRARKF